MPAYARPGVYVNEAALKATVINRPGRTTASFVGQSTRGPIGKPVLISSWSSFTNTFGDINASYELGYSMYQFFSNGGVDCYVVRVLTASTTANTASLLALTHGSSQSLFTATSKLAGADGDNVTLHVTKAATNPDTGSGSTVGGSGIIDLVVKYKGVTVETHPTLTFDNDTGPTSATIAVNHAVTGSQYITVSAQPTDANVTGAKIHAAFTTEASYTLAGGVTGGTAAKATGFVRGNTAGATANHFLLTAENSGAWGSDLTVEVTAGLEGATATSYGTFTMIVKLDGLEKERWTEVSLDSTHNRYVKTMLDTYSDYVTVSSVATPTKATNTSVTAGTYTLVGGSDGTAAVAGDYTTALNYLDQVTGDLLINLPGVTDSSEVNSALSYATTRGTGFVIIDADPDQTTASQAVTAVAPYTNSGYGAVYYPAATVGDPTKTGPAALRTAPLGGAIMAVYGKSERTHSVAKAPAGLNLDIGNVFGLVGNYTDADEGTLYDASINPVRLVPGTGAILNGTRTLAQTSPDKFIPIRRTLNFVKARMTEITKFAVFEPNDGNLRERVKSVVEQELRTLWGRRGLKGSTSAQAYYVTCDSTNNTSSTIANGELHVEVGLALQYPTEFVIINVSQWTGGSNAVDTL
jgi:hypothetical protein